MAQKENKSKKETKYPLAAYFEYYNQFLDSSIGKALNLRKISERFVYEGTKNGIKISNAASKVFKGSGNGKAVRLEPGTNSDLFDLSYNEDQLMIQQTIEQFAVKMRNAAEKIDDAFSINEELWNDFNELQLSYLQVPESLGGIMKDKSTVTQMMMVETLAHGDLGQALAFFTRHSVLNAIINWGTDIQQTDLVPEFLQDQPVMATIAINEPTPLFSPYELSTTAEKEGTEYILNGKKNMVPLGETCSYFLVAGKTKNKTNQLFIVNKESKGLTVTLERSMGLNAAQLCELNFENVKVHETAILGGNDGINYNEFINYCKLGWCALAVGCCQAVLDYVIPYANDRFAFGEPISHRQAVAFMIADIKIELESMRILTQRAVSKAEQGLDFEKEVYLAHLLCSEKGMQIGSNGIQLLGGHGFIRDFPVERWYRDLRAVSIAVNGLHL